MTQSKSPGPRRRAGGTGEAFESSGTFEENMKRLETIVQELEAGELGLEQSLQRFEEGMKLVRACEKALAEAEKRVELLIKDSATEELHAVPFAVENDSENSGTEQTPTNAQTPQKGDNSLLFDEENVPF
jgi:exodeoxyribonuclease VII small subunit